MEKIVSVFQDKTFIIFLIFVFLFYIIFYQFISHSTKKEIFKTLSNPIMLVFLLCLICFILYHHFTTGIILILALLLSLTFQDKKPETTQNTKNTQTSQNTQTTQSPTPIRKKQLGKHVDLQIEKSLYESIINENNQGNQENQEGYKNFVSDTLSSITNQLKAGIKQNKINELSLRENYQTTNNISLNNNKKSKNSKNNNSNSNNNSNNNSKTIHKRRFDLTKDEDKRLVYSKEVLEELINRINYKYDDRKYLKKYIGSKIEELVDVLELVDDDEED
tara:strand:- start:699 stop:1529 length:831 start_codon:yes stop_codon:yes gene_type:complete